MSEVRNLRHIRPDGIVIPEGASTRKIPRLGVERQSIIRVEWESDDGTVVLKDERGLYFISLPDRSGLVGIVQTVVAKWEVLAVINADGTSRFTLGNIQTIGGTQLLMSYSWFEAARTNAKKDIGVVCSTSWLLPQGARGNPPMYHLDIDPNNGSLLSYSRAM